MRSTHYEDLGIRNTLDLSWIFDEKPQAGALTEGAERGPAIKDAAR
jgi:hypothetical protein